MASYVVLERRPAAGRRIETELVRDEFSYLALIFPLVWLLWYRLWFAAIVLLLVSVGIGMIGEYLAPGPAMFVAGLVVSFFVALEGSAWRIAKFRRLGYLETGAVVAPSLSEAEIRWFAGSGAPPQKPAPVTGHKVATPPPLPAADHPDMVFGFAGER
tara:strand:- start:27501 stop:27974 length:474 start_codon:yes stop_codon:yes gene_type:complete